MRRGVRPIIRLTVMLTALALVAAACGDDTATTTTTTGGVTTTRSGTTATTGSPSGQAGNLSGSIFVSGSSTVEPISAGVAAKFNKENPSVAIRVDGPGTGDGFAIFCEGESDISDASRAIKKEEADKCAAKGIEFIELKVAIDGLSVITAQGNNQVECLSFEDLYALLGPESQGFQSWSDANALGKEVGGSGDYPNAALVVTAPGEESGTYDSFVELALAGTATKRNQEAEARIDYTASPNDNLIVDGIVGNPTSLGWVGYSFVAKNPALKALPIEKSEGQGCVAPTAETIADGTFPLARPLYIYVNKGKAESSPALAAYVDFYLSDAGLKTVEEVNYVPLESSVIATTQSVWKARKTGTASS